MERPVSSPRGRRVGVQEHRKPQGRQAVCETSVVSSKFFSLLILAGSWAVSRMQKYKSGKNTRPGLEEVALRPCLVFLLINCRRDESALLKPPQFCVQAFFLEKFVVLT